MDLNEIKRLKKLKEDAINRTITNWDSYPEERHRLIKRGMADRYHEIGIYSLLLDDKANALELFHKSVDLFEENIEIKENAYPNLLDLIHAALFSRDMDLMNRASSLCGKIVDKEPKITVHYIKMLCDLIDGDHDSVKKNIKVIKENPDGEEYFSLYLDELAETVLEKDAERMKKILHKVLESHDQIRARYYGNKHSYNYVICIPATCLLILAKGKGVKVKKEDVSEELRGYIPWIILEEDKK